MKANSPALLLYFAVCIFCVLTVFIGKEWMTPYGNAIVVPSICYYFFVTSRYRISVKNAVLFLFCFIGDLVFLMQYEDYFMISLLCYFGVYLLLLSYLVADFRTNKFRRIDLLPIAVVVVLIVYLFVTILNLKLEQAERYYETFVLYGITLSILGAVCILNYIAKGSRMATHAVIMFICFLISDIFYLLTNYYYDLTIFHAIVNASQLFAYYFMVHYLLLRGMNRQKSKIS